MTAGEGDVVVWEGHVLKGGPGGFTTVYIEGQQCFAAKAFDDWLRGQRAGLAPWETGPRVRITLQRLEPIPATKDDPLPDDAELLKAINGMLDEEET